MQPRDLDPKASWVLLAIIFGNPGAPNYEISSKEILALLGEKISEPTFLRAKRYLLGKEMINQKVLAGAHYFSPNFPKIYPELKPDIARLFGEVARMRFFRESMFDPAIYPARAKFPSALANNMAAGAALETYIASKNGTDENFNAEKYIANTPSGLREFLGVSYKRMMLIGEEEKKTLPEENRKIIYEKIKRLGKALFEGAAKFYGF